MIDPATGMKPGQRYTIESRERAPQFPGFFLDAKYYLGPELLTAIGWMEGQRFLYDDIDPQGQPVYPDRIAGTIEDLNLTLADGTQLKLEQVHQEARLDTLEAGNQTTYESPRPLSVRKSSVPKACLVGGALLIAGLLYTLDRKSRGKRLR
ncbi:short chain dehydrogenase [Pseudomonas auratipiscis]|uniref:Short chain dehydrogenase n=1 Tax=Pseudomonas auratipiscis TaxID=3115853 RepID=A0AB35WS67_9PSED|nr:MULTISPECIES: short chain dehydrogenase [unclassified Pseudomonas]MEE1864934.1 short chain dehydrogenase [Pseudomonas sp. 120P]MEE1956125.1 short chain dehydrogenase [Pseudomonas sp. 119P]